MIERRFPALLVRNYRLYASGQLTRQIGTWLQFTAQDWLVLQLSHNSPSALGLVTACQFTPVLLFTLYAGKLADRFDKRKMMIMVASVFGVLALSLGLLVVTGVVQLWHVFAFAAAMGTVNAIEQPVRQAFVSEVVGAKLIPNAMALNGATFNSARIIGPALAGVLISVLGTGPVFLVNAVLCSGPVVSALRMRVTELHRDGIGRRRPEDTKILDGLRYVWQRPDLTLTMGMILVVGMMGFNFQNTLAVLAKTVFHTGAQSFGLLTTALAVGALGGALAGSGRRGRPSMYLILVAGTLFAFMETLVGTAPNMLAAVLLLIPTGFFMIFFAQAANQRVQLGAEPHVRGRVVALYVLVFMGTTPVGAPLIGYLQEHFGARSGLWIGGLASMVATLIALAVQFRRTRAQLRVHLRPTPHVHVWEPAGDDGAPVVHLRVPAVRPAAR